MDELYHFGILGMRWGQRNGPPYPLGRDVSTGRRLKDVDKKEKHKAKGSGGSESGETKLHTPSSKESLAAAKAAHEKAQQKVLEEEKNLKQVRETTFDTDADFSVYEIIRRAEENDELYDEIWDIAKKDAEEYLNDRPNMKEHVSVEELVEDYFFDDAADSLSVKILAKDNGVSEFRKKYPHWGDEEIADAEKRLADAKEELKRAERALGDAEKTDIIRSGSKEEIALNKDRLTENEYREAVNRLSLDKQLNEYRTKSDFDKTMERLDNLRVNVERGVNAYNTVAKLYNTFIDPTEHRQLRVINGSFVTGKGLFKAKTPPQKPEENKIKK